MKKKWSSKVWSTVCTYNSYCVYHWCLFISSFDFFIILENHLSPEFPPIAGYTGHIPRVKGSEASLSQRYHCAAKKGLELLQKERESRRSLAQATMNVDKILREAEGKYTYGRG